VDSGGASFSDYTLHQEVVLDLECRKCGYNLRGLNIYRPCPECGEDICRSVEAAALRRPQRKRVDHKWRWIACVSSGGNLLLVLAFCGILSMKGIGLNALSPYHQPPLGVSVAGSVRQSASVIFNIGFVLGLAIVAYCIVLGVIAVVRRDTTTLIILAASFIVAVTSIFLAVAIGFSLAGI
jgi:hypothetical protein